MNERIDQEAAIELITPVSNRVDALNEAAWSLRYRSEEDAERLYSKAIELSQSGEFAGQPYLAGLATGLTISGFVKMLNFKLDQAMPDLSRALSILDTLPPLPATCDARCAICWVNIYIGEYSTAMDYALQAVQLARSLDHKDRLAYALDLLGILYTQSGEFDQALESHHEALATAATINIPEISMVLFNNMADSLYHMGRYPEALEYSMKAVSLAKEHGLLQKEMTFKSSVAEILTKLGRFPEAEAYLTDDIVNYHEHDMHQPYLFVVIMLGMAGLNLAQEKFQEAEPYYIKALETARENDFKDYLMECHELLSEIYEALGQPSNALWHHRQFHTLQTTLAGADTARKITLLKAGHQMEIARRETESYRQQNLVLQHEIVERKRVEALLAELAIRDPLTNLFNRRHFFDLAEIEYERTIRYNHPFCVMMLDIDLFKNVNDHYGHQVGDQVLVALAEVLQTSLRDSDIVGKYGGEEFIAILSETPALRAIEVGERLRKTIAEMRHPFENEFFTITASIGMSELSEQGRRTQPFTLKELVNQADQALYAAKHEGRNRVKLFLVMDSEKNQRAGLFVGPEDI